MNSKYLPKDQILIGDCNELMQSIPDSSIDLIFADPPYFLQLKNELWRPNQTKVNGVDDDWDQFDSFDAYDKFTKKWLTECKRVLKDEGTIWVIGTYHNIFRIGSILQDLNFWILNDVIWIKNNPMPNFRGVRLTNAHETLIWACKTKDQPYTFNYRTMKAINNDLQMRSDWQLPICTGSERIKKNGKKAHPTQKPEALLYRVLLSSTKPGQIVLDPFFGTGTTGVIAKRLHRHFIGIEKDKNYASLALERISSIHVDPYEAKIFEIPERQRREPRLSFGSLLEYGLVLPGQTLYFRSDRNTKARIRSDGHLIRGQKTGSIHQLGRHLLQDKPCNGWKVWFYETTEDELRPIDDLRDQLRKKLGL